MTELQLRSNPLGRSGVSVTSPDPISLNQQLPSPAGDLVARRSSSFVAEQIDVRLPPWSSGGRRRVQRNLSQDLNSLINCVIHDTESRI